ncbi:MAG: thermonuclease family protein [Rhodospirillales bacterium]
MKNAPLQFFVPALFALFLLLAPQSARAEIEGQPEIIDGDTLSIAGVVFNLYGIDAPESDQTCRNQGGAYPCGFQAANVLAYMTAYQWIKCRDRGVDPDRQTVMTCLLGGRYDLGERLIRQGWALADRKANIPAYLQAEQAARAEGAGLWAGSFAAPWDWRQGKR